MMHLSEYSCCICYMREKYMCPPPSLLLQLKGSDLELTIVKGSSAPRAPLNGPACTYVNLRLKVNNKEQGGTKWHWTIKPVTVSFKAYILSHCPACLPVYLFTCSCSEGVVLLENPRGDNRADLDGLKKVCSSVFGTNNTKLRVFSDGAGED